MILGQLRIWARQTTYAALITGCMAAGYIARYIFWVGYAAEGDTFSEEEEYEQERDIF